MATNHAQRMVTLRIWLSNRSTMDRVGRWRWTMPRLPDLEELRSLPLPVQSPCTRSPRLEAPLGKDRAAHCARLRDGEWPKRKPIPLAQRQFSVPPGDAPSAPTRLPSASSQQPSESDPPKFVLSLGGLGMRRSGCRGAAIPRQATGTELDI